MQDSSIGMQAGDKISLERSQRSGPVHKQLGGIFLPLYPHEAYKFTCRGVIPFSQKNATMNLSIILLVGFDRLGDSKPGDRLVTQGLNCGMAAK